MRIASSLTLAAALFVAAPVVAQTPPPAPEAAAPMSPEEQALNTKAQAFSAEMQRMGTELEAAVTAAGTDQAKAMTDVDAVLARYRPGIDTFADEVAAFLNAESAKATDPEEKSGLAQAATSASTAIRGIADQARAQIQQGLANPAPAAPATPPAQ